MREDTQPGLALAASGRSDDAGAIAARIGPELAANLQERGTMARVVQDLAGAPSAFPLRQAARLAWATGDRDGAEAVLRPMIGTAFESGPLEARQLAEVAAFWRPRLPEARP